MKWSKMKAKALVFWGVAWMVAAIAIAIFDPPIWMVWTEALAPVVVLIQLLRGNRNFTSDE